MDIYPFQPVGSVADRLAKNPHTKQAQVIALLLRPEGATVVAIMAKTRWRRHTVRAFLAKVVRRKFRLNLIVERQPEGRRYRLLH